jgi:hypothetical protein
MIVLRNAEREWGAIYFERRLWIGVITTALLDAWISLGRVTSRACSAG